MCNHIILLLEPNPDPKANAVFNITGLYSGKALSE